MINEGDLRTASRGDARVEFDDLAGHLNAQHGRLIDAAIWTLHHEIDWQGEGLTSPAQFLCWRLAIGEPTAKKALVIAERADELPECVQAVRDGTLSFDQMVAIARRVPAWADRQVLNLAERLTVSQLQRLVARYPWASSERRAGIGVEGAHDAVDEDPADVALDEDERSDDAADSDPDVGGDDEAFDPVEAPTTQGITQPADTVSYGRTADGRWFLHAELGLDAGMIVENALNEARDRLFHDTGHSSNVDAFVDVAERSLDAITSTERRNRFRTNIHLHTDGIATDALGRALPDCISDHITCDGLVTPVFHESGIPVSVGRSQHIVPDRTRRIVIQRDGGCTVPGCSHTGHLEIHHIIHWSDDGPTDTWNLVCLCPRHHRMHHQGRLSISGNADLGTVRYLDARGRDMARRHRPRPPTGPPPPPAHRYRPPCGGRLDHDCVSFTHPSTLSHEIRRNVRD